MQQQSKLIRDDIDAYLDRHARKDMLRFITCGSVDDGKSTLIGRLLHDARMIHEDQLAAVKADSKRHGTTQDEVDLALLVDGLQSEREQGITIDVAYRYFSTDKRKFIIADTPGHEQYTRNMVTGASTADLAVILIDARKGVLTQTRRHSFLVSLLGIRHVVLAINKMDMVGYRREDYEKICQDYLAFAEQLEIADIRCIPISALCGDNVVKASERMPWYDGEPLMTVLETMEIANDRNLRDLRFPVQYVNRPSMDFRGYCGSLVAGTVRKGDEVMVLPSRRGSRVAGIHSQDGELEEAVPPMSVTITLEDDIDVSRGDWIVSAERPPAMAERLLVHLVWMDEQALEPGRRYRIKQATRTVNGTVAAVRHKVDVNTLEQHEAHALALNEIGLCQLELEEALPFDPYAEIRASGSLILIDRLTNATVAAGMVVGAAQSRSPAESVSSFELELNALIRKHYPHWGAKDISKPTG